MNESQTTATIQRFLDELAGVRGETPSSRSSPPCWHGRPIDCIGFAPPCFSRILDAIENLPEHEREVFSLVRIQGMTHTEVADILGISTKTVQRRLNLGLLFLTEKLGDLRPITSAVDQT